MTCRKFNHIIKIENIELDVRGTYYPHVAATGSLPPEDSIVEVESIYLNGSTVDLTLILDKGYLEMIDNKIDRIESGL